jgi:hypothetical protein
MGHLGHQNAGALLDRDLRESQISELRQEARARAREDPRQASSLRASFIFYKASGFWLGPAH